MPSPPAIALPDAKAIYELQGIWVTEQWTFNGKSIPEQAATAYAVVFRGDKIEWIFGYQTGGQRFVDGFKVNKDANPKNLSVELLSGPQKGKIRHGIYEIDGDKMKLCLPYNSNESVRPKEFTATEVQKESLYVLTRLTRELPRKEEQMQKANVLLAPQLYESFKSDLPATIYKYQGKEITVTGEVMNADATRLGFRNTGAAILLAGSKDFTHGNNNIAVVFNATEEKPFSLRFLQYLKQLTDGTTITATGRCVIRKADGKFILTVYDASLNP